MAGALTFRTNGLVVLTQLATLAMLKLASTLGCTVTVNSLNVEHPLGLMAVSRTV